MGKPVGNVEHSPGFPPVAELLGEDPHPLEEGREAEQLCWGGSEGRIPVMSVKRGIQTPALQDMSQGTPEFGTFLPKSLTVLVFLWCVDPWSQPTPTPLAVQGG